MIEKETNNFKDFVTFFQLVFCFVSVVERFITLLGFIIRPVLDLITNALKHLKRLLRGSVVLF